MCDIKIELMRIGRRKMYLEKCIKVVELLAEHETENTIRKRIFEMYIKPIVFCSYVQFNNMLNERNPHLELETLENKIKQLKNIIPSIHIKILNYLYNNENASIETISNHIHRSVSYTGDILRKLVSNGYAVFIENTYKYYYNITEKGIELLDEQGISSGKNINIIRNPNLQKENTCNWDYDIDLPIN